MAETLIKIDLSKSAYENENIHNRWHPDIPMAATVKPGDDFILECYDWTSGQIKNDDSADDVRDHVHQHDDCPNERCAAESVRGCPCPCSTPYL